MLIAFVLSEQACEGLPETGMADAATWAHLLGDASQSSEASGATSDEVRYPSPICLPPAVYLACACPHLSFRGVLLAVHDTCVVLWIKSKFPAAACPC